MLKLEDIYQIGFLGQINFTENEKRVYKTFAGDVSYLIICYLDKYNPINNIPVTLSKLASLIRKSSLEYFIQDNKQLISLWQGSSC